MIEKAKKGSTGDQSIHDIPTSQPLDTSQIIRNQKPIQPDMEFRILASFKLDHLEEYNALGRDNEHYKDNVLQLKDGLRQVGASWNAMR